MKFSSTGILQKISITNDNRSVDRKPMRRITSPFGSCALSWPEAHGVSANEIKQLIAARKMYFDIGSDPREIERARQLCKSSAKTATISARESGNSCGRFPCLKAGPTFQASSIYPELQALLLINGIHLSEGESD